VAAAHNGPGIAGRILDDGFGLGVNGDGEVAVHTGYTCIAPVPALSGGGGGLLALGTADGRLRFADVGEEKLLGSWR